MQQSGRAGRDDLPGIPHRETFQDRAGMAIENRRGKLASENFDRRRRAQLLGGAAARPESQRRHAGTLGWLSEPFALRGRDAAAKSRFTSFPAAMPGWSGSATGRSLWGWPSTNESWAASAAPSSYSRECWPQNPHLKEIITRSDSAAELRSVYPVHFPSRRCVADGALLVGDAARVSEPVTGEGIYFAMRSGLLAAETIDLALRRG